MERQEESQVTGGSPGWDAWDAVPRDGPAIFVIDAGILDREGRIRGRWIELGVGDEALQAQLAALVDQGMDSTWAVVDQVGLGPRMVAEDVRLDELAGLPTTMSTEGSP